MKRRRSKQAKIKTIQELNSPTKCNDLLSMAGMKKIVVKVKSWTKKIEVNIIIQMSSTRRNEKVILKLQAKKKERGVA